MKIIIDYPEDFISNLAADILALFNTAPVGGVALWNVSVPCLKAKIRARLLELANSGDGNAQSS